MCLILSVCLIVVLYNLNLICECNSWYTSNHHRKFYFYFNFLHLQSGKKYNYVLAGYRVMSRHNQLQGAKNAELYEDAYICSVGINSHYLSISDGGALLN